MAVDLAEELLDRYLESERELQDAIRNMRDMGDRDATKLEPQCARRDRLRAEVLKHLRAAG